MRKSQKLSLAVVTEKKIRDALKDLEYVDKKPLFYLRSDTAEDILAKKKFLQADPTAVDWKIIR